MDNKRVKQEITSVGSLLKGETYLTKFQVPEEVIIMSFLSTKVAYVIYTNNPSLGECLLNIDRINSGERNEKVVKVTLNSIKSESWGEIGWKIFGSPNMTDEQSEEVNDKISEIFKYGEYADLELVIDKKFNIVGGKILPFKKQPL